MTNPSNIYRIGLTMPPCSVGITDGSERGDYVPQSYLFNSTGRPHHVVNLMFQYYPDIPGWPTQGVKRRGCYKNNDLVKGDGYFPLVLENEGPWGQLYLRCIEEIRAHGQEAQLTLTLHANTPDEDLIRIAESLVPYTPMRIRINHEVNGTWFYFHQCATHKQLSDFFIRFHHILHRYAPGVSTVACWNGTANDPTPAKQKPEPWGEMIEDELAPMFRVADIISYDQYSSLNYGWPNPGHDPLRPPQFFKMEFEDWWKGLVQFHDELCAVLGRDANIEIHEINEEADVVGYEEQARWITRFYEEAAKPQYAWLSNITFYHFRDRGGLGLELEHVDTPTQFTSLPALSAYRSALQHPHFAFRTERKEPIPHGRLPALRWSSPVSAEGLELEYIATHPRATPVVRFPADSHLLVCVDGAWHLKKHGMTELPAPPKPKFSIQVFAPPTDGRNNRPQGFDCQLAGVPLLP